MISDIYTVIWKEWKESLLRRGSRRGGVFGIIIILAVFGAFLPWQMGRFWLQSPVTLFYWVWVPLFLVINVIADAFAGERERHTLETLLASPLSDRAILLGKAGAAIGYGWGVALIGLLLGLVTVNLAAGHGRLLFYSPLTGLGSAGLSLLGSGLAAGAGVLLSLRAATVRQVQQTLSIGLMVLVFVPIFVVNALPAGWKAHLFKTMTAAGVTRIVLYAAVVLLVLDLVLLAAGIARFKRARLILD
ncbi:ABC transporter permease [Desulfotomaculum copahuensis]|uniref:ABC-2 type transporter n=1 Tax=Desulfotomaculum copahuensis TaxID=1838280 RepID=A0A1B7LAJ2_9FIRM|nr:ABC transporter permease subunit [Desulfotomaculum copahuensis]OAT79346.1 hypothetical protein A6M21_15960 [Desulfotomaculum copahuensis]